MGCGQSKIHLYPRKSKSKANGKKGAHADSDAETDEDEGGHIEDNEQTQCQERDKGAIAEESSNKDATPDVEEEVSLSLFRAKNFSLLQSQLSKRREISTSQQNFFRMLDKKIEEGPDYDSASETEIALEEARLNALVQHWESASITASICSSASRSLQTTPVRQPPITKQMPTPRMMLQNQATYLQAPGDYMIQQQLQGGVMLAPISKQQIQQQQLQQQQHHQLAANLQQQQQQQQLYAKIIQQHTLNNLGINLHLGSATGATTTATPSAAASSAGAATTLIQPLTSNGGASLIPTTISTASSTISPKHAVDELLVQHQQQQQQQQQQMLMHLQNQYNNVNIELSATNVKYINGGRSPPLTQQQQQQAQPLTHNYEYYEQQQQDQQQQQQLEQQQQQGGVAYYGELTATSSSSGVLPATPAPPQSQQQPPPPTEYRFPPAISVQRLAPQVQRQLRETQELIKDSCPQLYATGYGSPGPPMRNPTRHHLGANRRPTLETQFSQELS